MAKPDTKRRADLLQGTLDMLILKTLTAGQMHGYAIARSIQQSSQDALVVEEGSLYPALHRMARRGLIEHEWGLSESNRRAKYYKLTGAGRKQLKADTERWSSFSAAIGLILNPPAVQA
ncbi:lineage-specific thermal regulator protein [Posidoniimonas polymericola]|uniref:Lineage-specific thermal regulator protein n=1 Tax=Posidoniimonas polymericola TaxID=2528002 RepID=A0A5C5YI00_9BACT|nr:PadR family transcriptional regulator [Posidoniimonas polymericola]TWT73842.1 lineage-specific thermal regulator protein [Posidoniimonas polymericola]